MRFMVTFAATRSWSVSASESACIPFGRKVDSSRCAVTFASAPGASAKRWTVGSTRLPKTGASERWEVQIPPMNCGALSERTPITVSVTCLPVCWSRTVTLTGSNVSSSR